MSQKSARERRARRRRVRISRLELLEPRWMLAAEALPYDSPASAWFATLEASTPDDTNTTANLLAGAAGTNLTTEYQPDDVVNRWIVRLTS